MGNDVMWFIWWALTVGICAWKIGEAFVRPKRMLEWPFLACAMWAYFYGYMAFNAKMGLSAYLGNGLAELGQLMDLLCLVGLLVGWSLGTRVKIRRTTEQRAYPYFAIWAVGFAFILVGAAGGISVMRATATGSVYLPETSAYWYLLFYVGYPGLAMAIWTLYKMPPSVRPYLWVITLVGLAAFMYPHLTNARRGPLFPAIIVMLLVPPITTKRAPNPVVFGGFLAAAGLVMLLFLQVREVTYNGGTWNEAIQHLSLGAAITDKAEQAEDNEYINNCQVIGTIFQNGKYQYGTGHLELFYHWIPRQVWRDKPTIGEGSYSFDEMWDDVAAVTGFHLLGATGGAVGGVADSFVQYGIFCPLFWFCLSWGTGRIYAKMQVASDPRWLFSYVGFICASHWLISQSFVAAWVPGMCFQAVPLAVFTLFGAVSQMNSATSKGGRNRSRGRMPVPDRPALNEAP